MPVAKSNKFFYLDHEESVVFNLVSLGSKRIEKDQEIYELAPPFLKHVSKTAFVPSGRKTMVCAGAHCELCEKGFKPSKFYPVHIIIKGEQYGTHDGTEKIFDMPTSAHEAIVGAVKGLQENDKTEEEILKTDFLLERLKPNMRPYFTCLVRYGEMIDEAPDEIKLTDEDMEILSKLDKMLKTGTYKNPRGAMYRTLRERYQWTEQKVMFAFDTVLTEEGFLREDDKNE